ncbi:TB2/DP1, HVA22 family-domain-containing protein [Lipomyces oligophaga]|uniref:TB2/DP1, HVA22 family-domain-containing protein n=1 Tax=Lipomyces oligophaga TaxID=45792 RepID=UPI0034CF4B7A
MFGIISLATSIVTVYYPVYSSSKAIRDRDLNALQSWMVFWIVTSVVTTAESAFGFLISWLPFYGLARFLFFASLLVNDCDNGNIIYYDYLYPSMLYMDHCFSSITTSGRNRAKELGLQYWDTSIYTLKDALLAFLFGSAAADPSSSNISSQSTSSQNTLKDNGTTELKNEKVLYAAYFERLKNFRAPSLSRECEASEQEVSVVSTYSIRSVVVLVIGTAISAAASAAGMPIQADTKAGLAGKFLDWLGVIQTQTASAEEPSNNTVPGDLGNPLPGSFSDLNETTFARLAGSEINKTDAELRSISRTSSSGTLHEWIEVETRTTE